MEAYGTYGLRAKIYDRIATGTATRASLAKELNVTVQSISVAWEKEREHRVRAAAFHDVCKKGEAVRLSYKIADLDVSARTRNVMRLEGIISIADVLKFSRREILRLPNLGQKSLKEIEEVVAQLGFHLEGAPSCSPLPDVDTDERTDDDDLLPELDVYEFLPQLVRLPAGDKLAIIAALVESLRHQTGSARHHQ